MTSAEAHPSVEILAELVEGSLDEAVTGASASHVDQCAACQDVMEQVRGVSTALQQLPPELPVPEHVSIRVSAALAAEAAAGGRAESTAPVSDTGTVAWFRRRVPQAMAAAATIAVIGLAGYTITADTGGSDMSTAGSGGDSAESAELLKSGPGSYAAQDEAVPENDAARGGSPLAAANLEAEVEAVWEQPTELTPECGTAVADELGMDVVGSVESGSGVLIVLTDQQSEQLRGELLPTCGSTTNEALTSPVTIAVPR